MEIYSKYRSKDVAFVGLTTWREEVARKYVESFEIPWAIGFAEQDTIRKLGAAAATIYVVGRDGRVVWSDNSARFNHDLGELKKNIEAAIEQALQAKA